VTRLGIILDPLADKLLTAAAFLSLVEMGLAPAWMVMIILGRELAVTGLRNLALSRGVVIPASPLGKVKMVSQVVAIFLLLLAKPFAVLRPLAVVGLWASLVLAVVSGIDYFRRYFLVDSARNDKSPAVGRAPEGRSSVRA
jgi:CDP-diacylglycerol--glycerol-3-phosphate 3-phosphatidyltransferase